MIFNNWIHFLCLLNLFLVLDLHAAEKATCHITSYSPTSSTEEIQRDFAVDLVPTPGGDSRTFLVTPDGYEFTYQISSKPNNVRLGIAKNGHFLANSFGSLAEVQIDLSYWIGDRRLGIECKKD